MPRMQHEQGPTGSVDVRTAVPVDGRAGSLADSATAVPPAGPGQTSVGGAGGARRWPRRPFRTPVRGHAFAPVPPVSGAGEDAVAAEAPVRFRREPANPADPLAVAVWTDGPDGTPWRVGYLDRAVAARVAPRLDAGLEVEGRLDGWISEPRGRWLRPLLRLGPREGGPVQADGRAPAAPERPDLPPLEGLASRPPGVRRRTLRRRRSG